MSRPSERIAVCSWSLQPRDPSDLLDKLKQTGVSRLQLALDPLHDDPNWSDCVARLESAGIQIVSGMFGCEGEDYSTLESIRRTGGIAPDATWDRNLEHIRRTAALAARIGLRLVTFHAGFVPHDEADPDFSTMLQRLRLAADLFAAHKIELGLETGQETAGSLAQLLRHLAAKNVVVNFDPANMILYGKGDPVDAIRRLAPWIRQVHIKDAVPTATSGTWGREVRSGTGEVPWPEFFRTLHGIGYTGNFVIEREAGEDRIGDIRAAADLILRTA